MAGRPSMSDVLKALFTLSSRLTTLLTNSGLSEKVHKNFAKSTSAHVLSSPCLGAYTSETCVF